MNLAEFKEMFPEEFGLIEDANLRVSAGVGLLLKRIDKLTKENRRLSGECKALDERCRGVVRRLDEIIKKRDIK